MKRLLIVAVALGRPLHVAVLSLVIALGLYAGIRVAKGQPRTPSYSLPPDIGTQWQPGLTYNGGFPTGSWHVYNPSGYTCINQAGGSGDLAHI